MNKQNELMQIIEAVLFVYGDDGVSTADLETVLENEKPSTIQKTLTLLNEKYVKDPSSAFLIQKFNQNKYRLQTKPQLYEFLAKLEVVANHNKLSPTSIEVLTIVAYKGPLSKGMIDEIRGVDSTYQVAKLRELHLIRTVGKTPQTRANLYGLTDHFFKFFNLTNGLESLPKISDEDINDQVQSESAKQQNQNKDLFRTLDGDDEWFEGN